MSDDTNTPSKMQDDALSVIVLATGIAAMGTVIILGLGALVGLVGIVLGVVALLRPGHPRGMAAVGTALSIGAVVIGIAVAGLVYYLVQYTGFGEEILDDFAYASIYEDLTYWEGVVAPPLSGETVEGDPFDLSDHRGQKVVLYSVPEPYDEWQPVQRDELEELARAGNGSFQTYGLFLGSRGEYEQAYAGTVWPFPIVLSEPADSPYTNLLMEDEVVLVIDRNGTIQHVFMEETALADLEEAARGPDVEHEPALVPPPVDTGLPAAGTPLEPRIAWSVPMPSACHMVTGAWDDADREEVFVVLDCSRLARLDRAGNTIDMFELPEDAYDVAIGRYEGRPRVLAYEPWSYTLYVLDEFGAVAWEFETDGEIMDAAWVDLDGDGTDEIVYNVDYGINLEALSADGQRLWTATNRDDIYALAATRSGAGAAIAAVTYDELVLYNGEGGIVREVSLGNFYFLDAVVMDVVSGPEVQILALGDNELMAYTGTLQRRWNMENVEVPYDFDVTAADVSGDGTAEWAVPLKRNEIGIVSHDGRELARVRHKNWLTGVVMLPAGETPGKLFVLAGDELTAYEFSPAGAESEPDGR